MQKLTYTLFFQSSKLFIPSDFASISNIDSSIHAKLIKKHKYIIKSKVSNETIKSFINYWVYHKVPNISQDNVGEYEEISNEFQIMKNLIQIFKRKQEIRTQLQMKENSLEIKLKERKVNYNRIIDLLINYNKPLRYKNDLYDACKNDNVDLVSFLTGDEIDRNDINYHLNIRENTAAVSKKFQIRKKEIIIPSAVTYKGKKFIVKAILKDAFQNSKIDTVYFYEDSEVRTFYADFISNTNISTLYIPASVVELKRGWCWQTDNLCNIYLSPKNKHFAYIENKFIVGKSDEKSDVFDLLLFVRRDVKHITIPAYIKCILPFAFHRCLSLQSVTFEKNSELQEIKDFAFYQSSIKSITIPQHVTAIRKCAFGECESFSNIYLHPNSDIHYLGSSVFGGTKIQQFCIPESVNKLHQYFFSNCEITHLSCSPNNTNFKCIENKYIISKSNPRSDVFDCLIFLNRDVESITIPSFIKYICPFAFCNATQLLKVDFEDNSELITIHDFSFENTSIKEILIPKGVTHIGKSAFYNCSKLKKIKFEKDSKLEKIDSFAFDKTNVESICIPQKVKIILHNAFCNCKQLKKVTFQKDSELELIDFHSFTQTSISRIIIPKHVKIIGSFAFSLCKKLKRVDFHDKTELEKIKGGAFDCSSIKEISIPQNVREIGCDLFKNCEKLTIVHFHPDSKFQIIKMNTFINSSIHRISIPRSVTEIGKNAFANCKNLRVVDFPHDSNLKAIRDGAFDSTAITSIIIPESVKEIGRSSFIHCEKLNIIELSSQMAFELVSEGMTLNKPKQLVFKHDKNKDYKIIKNKDYSLPLSSLNEFDL
ncbi:hypothetical protein M9Y10_025818 [Tritrichomonas musculus]|uniref:Surface antigen BspA-like n=1 Tax=Tritrichomonas musculus TaxID=1915356 RepID=A0ABR2HB02_9EUKA